MNEVRKLLVISTAHLREETAKSWDARRDDATAHPIPYGYFCYVFDDGDDIEPEVWAACQLARKLGCQHIKYDCDAFIHDELETFNW